MKKSVILLVLSLLTFYAFTDTFSFIIMQNVKVQHDIGAPFIDVKKGSELTVDTDKTSIHFTDKGGISLSAKISNSYYEFDDSMIEFENHRISIPNELQQSYWILDYYFEMLKNQDINILSENEPYYHPEEEYVYNDRDELIPWQRTFCILYIKFGKYLIKSSNPGKFGDSMEFISFPINIADNVLELEVPTFNYQKMYETAKIWKKLTELKTPLKLFLKNDGDYLYVYKNSIAEQNLLYKLIRCDENTYDQINKFVRNENYNLSAVTWPHHADGTSEYEDTIRYPDPLVIEEPEQIEIEEYDNSSELADSSSAPAENLDRPPFPDKKDPDYWKILEKYYPDEYPKLRFEYLQKRTKIINTVVIPCAIVFGIILLVVLVLVIRKKRAK